MEISNAQETPGEIASSQESSGGGGIVATKESNFQSLERLNHSYNPGCHSQMLRVTPIQRPRPQNRRLEVYLPICKLLKVDI